MNYKLLLPAMISVFFLTACKKDGSEALTPAEEESIARASTEAETESHLVFDDVFNNVMGVNNDVAIGGTGIFGKQLSPDSTQCFTVTKTLLNAPALFPVKFVIDFGSAGCTGVHGHTRYGKIIIVYTGRLIFD